PERRPARPPRAVDSEAMPTRRQMLGRVVAGALAVVLLAAIAGLNWPDRRPIPRPPRVDGSRYATATPIKHVIFLVKENRTFDQLFGLFPGANGTTTGNVNGRTVPLKRGIPQRLPQDIVHSYAMALHDYDHGRMDGFAYSPSARTAAYTEALPGDIPI